VSVPPVPSPPSPPLPISLSFFFFFFFFFFSKSRHACRFAAADLFLFRGSYLDGSPGTSGTTSVRFCRPLSRHISSVDGEPFAVEITARYMHYSSEYTRRVHSRILRAGRDNARARPSYRPGRIVRIVWYFYVRARVYEHGRRRCREI